MNADGNVIKIKHDVLFEVAKLAFAGELEEQRDHLPLKLIPGPTPQFRCCIYKEREIIRQRIRLAEGKAPGPEDDGNIIQVISSACEDCPISSYTVTENCQNCLGKACINACKFGAIEPGHYRSHIDASKCKECGQCAKACPYNAIAHLKRPCKFSCPVDAITYDEHGISIIDKNKCIRCGKCIHSCPFGAIASKTFIVPVINALREGKHIYAMAAPATEGQFGADITMESWRKAMKELGFVDFYDVGLGGDMTAAYEAEEWAEAYKEGQKKVTSCCPAFVNMVRLHYPQLADNISTTVSPMCAISRMIKAQDPKAITVFIGPCLAKKSEVVDQRTVRYHQIEANIQEQLQRNISCCRCNHLRLHNKQIIGQKHYGKSSAESPRRVVMDYERDHQRQIQGKENKSVSFCRCKPLNRSLGCFHGFGFSISHNNPLLEQQSDCHIHKPNRRHCNRERIHAVIRF